MVQKYKRKTDRRTWEEDKMRKAIESIHNGLPFKTALGNSKRTLMSLKTRCKGKNKLASNQLKNLGSKTSFFNGKQETQLVNHMLNM